MPTDTPRFRTAVRTMQIITLAILGGLVTLIVVALVVENQRPPAELAHRASRTPFISFIAVAVAFVNILAAYVVPNVLVHASMKRQAARAQPLSVEAEASALLALRQTAQILTIALLEAAGFLGAIAYLMEGHLLGLMVSGAMAGFILSAFPTTPRIANWLETQQQRLVEMRVG